MAGVISIRPKANTTTAPATLIISPLPPNPLTTISPKQANIATTAASTIPNAFSFILNFDNCSIAPINLTKPNAKTATDPATAIKFLPSIIIPACSSFPPTIIRAAKRPTTWYKIFIAACGSSMVDITQIEAHKIPIAFATVYTCSLNGCQFLRSKYLPTPSARLPRPFTKSAPLYKSLPINTFSIISTMRFTISEFKISLKLFSNSLNVFGRFMIESFMFPIFSLMKDLNRSTILPAESGTSSTLNPFQNLDKLFKASSTKVFTLPNISENVVGKFLAAFTTSL